ncbi:C4-dicarboxylate ABC transporter substrate-binding protein [Planobispora rosea]|uniref:C4-dicarboxylate ABC transporter substrate-binding protein n=1 Tax=Planobispora rosea TaxID=35762 RepID=A0A8J3WDD2_PLARO|nr:TAXI family TRAP transporter solute-binding subunit [Planobispora rosea]GGT06449.1 C4-dicarboxylate ABC transporter substrate-binding protein [Planobispora rosea]GIH85205.1 C4-dicarboxylate ABC transporter substrate-binding protein [Planobispora rosea]
MVLNLEGLRLSRRAVLLAAGGVLAGCSRQPEVDRVHLRLATGPAGAVYRRIGGSLAEHISERVPGVTVSTVPSGASTDNIRMLRAGEVHLGLTSLDALITADGSAPGGLSAICRLYDSHLHLVVMAGSVIDEFRDLEGRRVSLGARGSGTEFTSLRVLELGRVNADGRYLSQAESAAALREGGIDAMFSLTGVPTPAITELAQRHAIRLVPLEAQADALFAAFPGPYAPAVIHATAYAGVPATRTVAVPNMLLARDDLPDDLVHAITGTIFTHTGSITSAGRDDADPVPEAVPEAWQINVRTGISTASIPLHPGAAAWFRDRKR